MDWKAEKERREAESQQRKIDRIMNSPITRAEFMRAHGETAQQIASVAIAIEAVEGLLIASGVCKENDIMARVKSLVREKAEQMAAADAVEATHGPAMAETLIQEP